MNIEKYVANPAANTWVSVTTDIPKPVVLRYVMAIANVLVTHMAELVFFVYRGTIAAYDVANNQYCMYAHRWVLAVNVNCEWVNPTDNMYVELPAGTYTFAAYVITDVANFKMAWHLSSN